MYSGIFQFDVGSFLDWEELIKSCVGCFFFEAVISETVMQFELDSGS